MAICDGFFCYVVERAEVRERRRYITVSSTNDLFISNDRDRVHCFVFGTRLTNISHQLRRRDVDKALDQVAESVEDWSGGTRIAESIEVFNRQWSRRVLAQGGIVLLITDGLDRDAGVGLERWRLAGFR